MRISRLPTKRLRYAATLPRYKHMRAYGVDPKAVVKRERRISKIALKFERYQ